MQTPSHNCPPPLPMHVWFIRLSLPSTSTTLQGRPARDPPIMGKSPTSNPCPQTRTHPHYLNQAPAKVGILSPPSYCHPAGTGRSPARLLLTLPRASRPLWASMSLRNKHFSPSGTRSCPWWSWTVLRGLCGRSTVTVPPRAPSTSSGTP